MTKDERGRGGVWEGRGVGGAGCGRGGVWEGRGVGGAGCGRGGVWEGRGVGGAGCGRGVEELEKGYQRVLLVPGIVEKSMRWPSAKRSEYHDLTREIGNLGQLFFG